MIHDAINISPCCIIILMPCNHSHTNQCLIQGANTFKWIWRRNCSRKAQQHMTGNDQQKHNTRTTTITKTTFYSVLFLAMSFHCKKKPSARVLHLSLSFAIPVHTNPCCPTMSSLQRHSGLPTDLTPSVCHSVLLTVHLLSFIQVMCPAHFHFVLVTYWTMSVTLALCLTMVLQILSFGLTLSILLSIARWLKTPPVQMMNKNNTEKHNFNFL